MAGSVIGPAIGAGISALGSKKSEKQFQRGADAAAPIIVEPKPFEVNTALGRSLGGDFFGNRAFNVNAINAGDLSNVLGRRARQASADGFAQRFLEAANRVNDRREAQGFANLESRLFNRSGVSTGTARNIADFRNDIEDRRFQRGIQAQVLGEQQYQNALNNFYGAVNNFGNISRQQLDQIGLGLQGTETMLPRNIGRNPFQAQAGAFRAQNTQSFFDGLGGFAGGAVDAGLSLLGGSGGGGGGGFFNPAAINFGSNPFV